MYVCNICMYAKWLPSWNKAIIIIIIIIIKVTQDDVQSDITRISLSRLWNNFVISAVPCPFSMLEQK